MKSCPNCGFEQEDGAFCANCGAQIDGTQQNTETAATVSQPSHNVNVEKVKNGLGLYWNYFLDLLKNPTAALRKDVNEFGNGLTTLILFTVTASLSMYFMLTKTMASLPLIGSPLSHSVPFFGANIRFVIVVAVLIAISFFSIVIMLKSSNEQTPVKSLLSQVGGLAVPFMALNALAILFALIGSGFLTSVTLGISFSLFLYFIPVLFVYEKISAVKSDGQKIYLSLATLIVISIATAIVSVVFIATLLNSLSSSVPF